MENKPRPFFVIQVVSAFGDEGSSKNFMADFELSSFPLYHMPSPGKESPATEYAEMLRSFVSFLFYSIVRSRFYPDPRHNDGTPQEDDTIPVCHECLEARSKGPRDCNPRRGGA